MASEWNGYRPEGAEIKLLSISLNGKGATSLKGRAKDDAQWFHFPPDGRRMAIAHSEERRDLVRLTK